MPNPESRCLGGCFVALLVILAALFAARPAAAQLESLSPGERKALVEGIVAATELSGGDEAGAEVVVQGQDGAPIGGVDVLVLPAEGWNALPRDERIELVKAAGRGLAARQVALAKRLGRRYRTGDDGRVRIATENPIQVVLLDERSVDIAVFRPGGDPVVFRIDDRPRLRVRVRDGIGRPAEGEVVTLLRGGAQLAISSTGPDGFAEFMLPEPGEDAEAPYSGLRVSLGFGGAHEDETSSRQLDAFQPGGPPVVLALPPSGMVRFILYGPDEKPVDRLKSASITYARGRSQHTRSASSTEGDSAMFEDVPLDVDVSVKASVDGLIGQLTFEGRGPRHPGELVIVEGRLASGSAVISGRIVDPEGHPLSGTVGLALVGTGSTRALEGELDGEGRFHLVVPEDVRGENWIDPSLYVVADREGAPPWMAAVEVEGLVDGAAGELPVARSRDLGDVLLQEPEVVVAGKLVDTEGKPLAGAAVTARHSIYGTSYSSSTRRFEHRATTAEDGSFELREVSPRNGPLRLTFAGEGFAVEGNVEAGLGEKDLRVEARPTGAIDLAVEGAPVDGFDVNVTLTRDGAPADVTQRIYLRNGKGSSKTIPAGTYDLAISVSHRDDPVVIEDVEVPAGGKATDPRLSALPWKDRFRLVRIVVRDANQKPIASEGTIWRYISGNNGRTGSGSHTNGEGVVTFLCPMENCTITADVDGYFKQSADADRDEIVLDLRPAPPVVVWLPADLELPKGLEVNFHMSKGNGSSYSNESVRPGQKVTFYPDEEGDHTVSLQLSWTHGQQQRQIWNRYRSLAQAPVKIGASVEPIEVEFEVDEELRERLQMAAEDLGLVEEGSGRR